MHLPKLSVPVCYEPAAPLPDTPQIVSQMTGEKILRAALFVKASHWNNSNVDPSSKERMNFGIFTLWNTKQEWKQIIHSVAQLHRGTSQTVVVTGFHQGPPEGAQAVSVDEWVGKFRHILVMSHSTRESAPLWNWGVMERRYMLKSLMESVAGRNVGFWFIVYGLKVRG